ncbi:MarR family winged helix-turn-helix transcriptional regulator [Streptacidiphilus sp. PAMC 29251]
MAVDGRPAGPGDSPGFLLWRATLAWQRGIAAVLRPLDLTHVQFVLLASTGWLCSAGERPPSQRTLADQTGTDPMTTSQVVRALEAKGLVERLPDPKDSRAKLVGITESGRAVLALAQPAVEDADTLFFAEVPRAEALAVLRPLAGERWAGE